MSMLLLKYPQKKEEKKGERKEKENRYDTLLMRTSVVNNFLFAHQTDILEDETKAAELRRNSKSLLQGIHLNKHLPWIPDFLESLPHSISRPMMPPGLIDLLHLFDVSRSVPWTYFRR